MNPVIDNIKNRRSIRKYLDKGIRKEFVDEIMDAGILAPSSHNSQPWNFIIISDKKKIQELSDNIKSWYDSLLKISTLVFFIKKLKILCGEMRDRINSERDLLFYNAPLVIIIHSKKKPFYINDCSCCAQNMMLAARSLGIGSCWIGFADIALNRSRKLRTKIGIPLSHQVVATIVFGYPERFPSQALPRKEFSKNWI